MSSFSTSDNNSDPQCWRREYKRGWGKNWRNDVDETLDKVVDETDGSKSAIQDVIPDETDVEEDNQESDEQPDEQEENDNNTTNNDSTASPPTGIEEQVTSGDKNKSDGTASDDINANDDNDKNNEVESNNTVDDEQIQQSEQLQPPTRGHGFLFSKVISCDDWCSSIVRYQLTQDTTNIGYQYHWSGIKIILTYSIQSWNRSMTWIYHGVQLHVQEN